MRSDYRLLRATKKKISSVDNQNDTENAVEKEMFSLFV